MVAAPGNLCSHVSHTTASPPEFSLRCRSKPVGALEQHLHSTTTWNECNSRVLVRLACSSPPCLQHLRLVRVLVACCAPVALTQLEQPWPTSPRRATRKRATRKRATRKRQRRPQAAWCVGVSCEGPCSMHAIRRIELWQSGRIAHRASRVARDWCLLYRGGKDKNSS